MKNLRHIRAFFLFAVLAVLACSPAFGAEPSLEQFESLTIGGVRVLLLSAEEFDGDATIFGVMRVGHGHQREGEAHCAYLAEQLIFKNPVVGRCSLDTWVSGHGAANRSNSLWSSTISWTANDYTQFTVIVPGRSLPGAIRHLFNALFPAEIKQETFDKLTNLDLKVRLQVMAADEARSVENAFLDHFYQGTPFLKRVLEVSANDVTSDTVLAFMQREYALSRLTLVIAGDFEKEAAWAALNDAVSNRPQGPGPSYPTVDFSGIPSTAKAECELVDGPRFVLGIGLAAVPKEEQSLFLLSLQFLYSRLVNGLPGGWRVLKTEQNLDVSNHSQLLYIAYEVEPTLLEEGTDKLAAQLLAAAKKETAALAAAGPTSAEIELYEAALHEMEAADFGLNSYSIAFKRGVQELPGQAELPFSKEELPAALQKLVQGLAEDLVYTVLIVEPPAPKSKIKPAVLALTAAGLGIAAAAVVLVLTRRKGRQAA
ncbi:MAG TPA: insulinase family protein [Firmicutes bacterium]|nr:insulinase family protein [Bacillota bacterium]